MSEKCLREVEIFRGDIRMHGNVVAVIGENDETFQTWLKKRGKKYKDKEVKIVMVLEEE